MGHWAPVDVPPPPPPLSWEASHATFCGSIPYGGGIEGNRSPLSLSVTALGIITHLQLPTTPDLDPIS